MPFFRWDGDTLVLNVLGKPGAKRDALGRAVQAAGGDRLTVHVAAVPEDGKATRRMLAFIAESFGVPRGAVELVHGQASVNKQFRIHRPSVLAGGVEPAPAPAPAPTPTPTPTPPK